MTSTLSIIAEPMTPAELDTLIKRLDKTPPHERLDIVRAVEPRLNAVASRLFAEDPSARLRGEIDEIGRLLLHASPPESRREHPIAGDWKIDRLRFEALAALGRLDA